MEWLLFILLNGAFFVRPGDLLQSADLPIYNILMVACLAVSGGRLVGAVRSASESPITVCVLGFVVACFLSQLSHGNLGRAAAEGFYILKIVIYFLLLSSLADTPLRVCVRSYSGLLYLPLS